MEGGVYKYCFRKVNYEQLSIAFYHVCQQTLEKAICKLVSEIYKNKESIVIKTPDITLQESINRALWTFEKRSFFPHGSSLDPEEASQPIYLTLKDNIPNQAKVLILVSLHDWILPRENTIKKIFIAFNEDNQEELSLIRQKYLDLKQQKV